ncbi:MAG: hypothetical protein F6K14_21635 [Symploca sp. SIO2C1]|nr:hypothetical protein [Symploca sp. SIO2C1]
MFKLPQISVVSILFITLLLSLQNRAEAVVKLPHLISDNMVLQRNEKVRIWGWADEGEKVTVSFNDQKHSTRAGKDRTWEIKLTPMQANSEPQSMTISGSNSITLSNILIGEVWIGSGQSNMRFALKYARDADKVIDNAYHSQIRLYDVGRTILGSTPHEEHQITTDVDLELGARNFDREVYLKTQRVWREATPESVENYSAYGYFFARDLQRELGVPVGMILAARGGTRIEGWMSQESLASFQHYDYTAELEAIAGKPLRAIERAVKERLAAIAGKRAAQAKTFDENDAGYQDGQPLWHDQSWDPSSWDTVWLPALLDDFGITTGYDGSIWLRKEFILPRSTSNRRHATLYLGKIDNSDEVWLNGRRLGGVENQRGIPREYDVHYKVLQPDAINVLVVRIKDFGGNLGFASKVEDFRLQFADREFPLAGLWQYKWGYKVKEVSPGPLGDWNLVNQVSMLYNGMIHPARKYTVKGVIWSQGEGNSRNAHLYGELMRAWIADWRTQFENPDLAFIWESGLNYGTPQPFPIECRECLIREAQTLPLDIPRTGIAIITGLGDPEEVHFTNKQEASQRLLRAALASAYGYKHVSTGPLYDSHTVTGDSIVITFKNTGSGLTGIDTNGVYTDELLGFAIAGSDRKFIWANAVIEKDKVVVSHPRIKKPVAVRYLWQTSSQTSNLYNKEGLPAGSFRTDRWEVSDRWYVMQDE